MCPFRVSVESEEEKRRELFAVAFQAGDDATLWQLAEGMRERLRGVAAVNLGVELSHKLDASDVVQSALEAAAREHQKFTGTTLAEWEAWLVVITRNEARSARRYWRRARRNVGTEERDACDAGLPNGTSTPSAKVSRKEEQERVAHYLSTLPPDEQLVVRMRHLESKSLDEITKVLGRTKVATAGLLKRAMERLRKKMLG